MLEFGRGAGVQYRVWLKLVTGTMVLLSLVMEPFSPGDNVGLLCLLSEGISTLHSPPGDAF